MNRAPAAAEMSSAAPTEKRALGVPALGALTMVYVVHTPLVGELATQTARADLFARSGDVAWWDGWDGGLAKGQLVVTVPSTGRNVLHGVWRLP